MPQNNHPITVYVNPHGDIVIRQEGSHEPAVIVLSADYVPTHAQALEAARSAATQVAG